MGLPWRISSNLEGALRVFRDLPNQTLLWIDGLCINQTSIEEKNYEVPFMSKIYRSADKTRVWLGPGTPRSQSALGFLPMFTLRNDALELCPPDKDGNSRAMIANCLAVLFAQPWWQRLWILQEYLLASEVVLYCGENDIDSVLLEASVSALKEQIDSIRTQKMTGPWDNLKDGESLSFLADRVLLQQRNLEVISPLCLSSRGEICPTSSSSYVGLEDSVYRTIAIVCTVYSAWRPPASKGTSTMHSPSKACLRNGLSDDKIPRNPDAPKSSFLCGGEE
jgi:hypothetical protein